MRAKTATVLLLPVLAMVDARSARATEPITPVDLTRVTFTSGMLADRLETNRRVTVPYVLDQCETTGRIRNFAVAGGLEDGGFQGIYFDDSDVFKAVEGAALSLLVKKDPVLEARLDAIIEKIASAQEDDGYLYTIRTIGGERLEGAPGPARWSNLAASHELYNIGHLYEAAVAHHRATGKRTLLDVAIRSADLVDRVFGRKDGQIVAVPGHEEIELGLVELFSVTGEMRYLDLARFFIDMRGRSDLRETHGSYSQDHLPVIEMDEPVGHAVRAGYLYAAMADLARHGDAPGTVAALDRIQKRLVSARISLTGGVGARRHGEAFGDDFELPNATAYNETCAAIASCLLHFRMFLLHGDGQYLDVLERTLYNGVLSGVSLEGDRFFYPNPLACDGVTAFNQGSSSRAPWFSCSCCPVNIVRFLPKIPGMTYALRGRDVYVNLYTASEARIDIAGEELTLVQNTRYPWDGAVALTTRLRKPVAFTLHLRIPEWARGRPLPGGLYRYDPAGRAEISLRVAGKEVPIVLDRGFAVIERTWSDGDRIDLELPMMPRKVKARDEVAACRDRVALEMGPIVFCFEGCDNGGAVEDIVIPPASTPSASIQEEGTSLTATMAIPARRLRREAEGRIVSDGIRATAIPYALWAHRDPGPMAVWMAAVPETARPRPLPTLASRARASASHTFPSDTVAAIHDRIEPTSSGDPSLPRHTFWPRKGTTEWIQLDFEREAKVSGVEVYWFDDTGVGACRVPRAWSVHHLRDGKWEPIPGASDAGTARDRMNRVTFPPLTTSGLRLVIELQDGYSAGVLEWTVD
jgi:hypothetical protein